jgi:hypothetical protein
MKISELISELVTLLKEHGDLPVIHGVGDDIEAVEFEDVGPHGQVAISFDESGA